MVRANVAGVIAAAALKCMGGNLQGRLWPRNTEEKEKAINKGYDLQRVCAATGLIGSHSELF